MSKLENLIDKIAELKNKSNATASDIKELLGYACSYRKLRKDYTTLSNKYLHVHRDLHDHKSKQFYLCVFCVCIGMVITGVLWYIS